MMIFICSNQIVNLKPSFIIVYAEQVKGIKSILSMQNADRLSPLNQQAKLFYFIYNGFGGIVGLVGLNFSINLRFKILTSF